MAHEFYIKTTSGEFVTYTDYDAIDLTTLKHVIKFLPDLGTLVDSHEILLETGTLDASATEGVITEEDNSVTATDGTTYAVPTENKLLLEDNGQIMYEKFSLSYLINAMCAVLFGSYSILSTFALTSNVFLLKSMILYFLLWPPPFLLEVK